MSNNRLADIWREITGSFPRVTTLPSNPQPVTTAGPRFAVYWMYSELDSQASYLKALYFEALGKIDSNEFLKRLAIINNALIVEPPFDRGIHQSLEQHFLRENLRHEIARVHETTEENQPETHIVFHRLSLLLNMKLALGIVRTRDAELNDGHIIGDLTLLANEFLRQDHGIADDKEALLEFVANWDINNLRDTAYTMSRYDRFLKDYLYSSDDEITSKRAQLTIDTSTFDGLHVNQHLTLLFAIYSTITNAVREQKGCVLSLAGIADSLEIPIASIEAFFANRATTPEDFCLRNAGGGWDEAYFLSHIDTDRFATDVTPLRQTPFVKLNEDSILVLDRNLVIDLLTTGLYWVIFDSLPSNKRNDFSSLWGRMFELYTVDLFRHYYPASSSIQIPFKDNVPYTSTDGTGQIDALLDYYDEVVIFEAKSSLLSLDARCNRDWDVFEKEIKLKFIENEKGKPKALRQLANAAKAVLSGAVLSNTPSKIYPVLISDEKALESFGMNKYLNQKFQAILEGDLKGKVYPLTVITIDELEELLPYILEAKFSWTDLLKRHFYQGDASIFSIHQALYDLKKENSIPQLRNEFALQRFEDVYSRIQAQCAHLQ